MRGKRMAKGMWRGALAQLRLANRLENRSLQDRLVQMMAAPLPGGPVEVQPGGREHPLPRPLPSAVGILAGQRPRQLDPAGAQRQVGLMLALYTMQMLDQRLLGQGPGDGVAGLAVADDDLIH